MPNFMAAPAARMGRKALTLSWAEGLWAPKGELWHNRAMQALAEKAARLPDSVREFRAQQGDKRYGRWYSGWAHLGLTSLGSLSAIIYAAGRVRAPSAAELAIIPAGFLLANLVEYLMHRNPMHRPIAPITIFYEGHTLEHHRFFTHEAMSAAGARDFRMVLFPPLTIFAFLGVIGVPFALTFGALISPNAGWLSAATSVAYFLSYEWLHLSYHLPPGSPIARLPLMAALRRHHTVHHDPRLMSRWNFNVNFPICDRLFGTRHP